MNEDVELSLGAKVRMLRGYLGQFYVTVPLDKRKLFSEAIPIKGMTVYAEGSDLALKELGAWYLLRWGEQSHVVETTYDIVNRFLGIMEDGEEDVRRPFANTTTSLLILMHMEYTIHNKRLPDIVAHTVESRQLLGKPTLVLSQVWSDSLYDFFRSRENTVCIRMRGVTRKLSSKLGGSEGDVEVRARPSGSPVVSSPQSRVGGSGSTEVSESGVVIEHVPPTCGAV